MNTNLLKTSFRRSAGRLAIIATLLAAWPAGSQPADTVATNLIRNYTVNRKVSEFPTNEDLSTPEAAYAAWNRTYAAQGDAAIPKLSVRRLAQRMPDAPAKPVPAGFADELLNCEVLEVCVYSNLYADVIARVPGARKTVIDSRGFEREAGRWLNTGQSIYDNPGAARAKFARIVARSEAERILSSRPPVANPEEHLRPFIEFLQRESTDPREFLLRALAGHRVVVLGEVHHRPRYWDFDALLVRAAGFPKQVGVIYLELPGNDQALVDQFLAAPKYDPQPVIEMLRDNLWMGWPDQPMLDFFKTVWEVNQVLPPEQRLRLVLVDMARPWQEIKARNDWRKYDVDRNQLMAENIVRDLREHAADPRHALFIVGYMHAPVNLAEVGGQPVKSAGWHLREMLGGTNVFAVFPHSPVMSNMGEVRGRLALGLFESAFAAMTNRPMAFPLDHGPFGDQVFDASLDQPTTDAFRRGFQGYLYLGPLEDEIFSPIIPDFYTDEFVGELDRRHRLMFGKGLVDAYDFERLDGPNFIRWMSRTWGQPRTEWSAAQLGPLNAWQLGSSWEKKSKAAKLKNWSAETNAIQKAAARLLDALRKANYEKPGDWRSFPAPDVDYQVATDYPGWMRWVCQHFRTNPITAVNLGAVTRQTDGNPAVPYHLTLQNGATLDGILPMKWDARSQTWFGSEGLDWHLEKKP
jgi:hypothetical protein